MLPEVQTGGRLKAESITPIIGSMKKIPLFEDEQKLNLS